MNLLRAIRRHEEQSKLLLRQKRAKAARREDEKAQVLKVTMRIRRELRA